MSPYPGVPVQPGLRPTLQVASQKTERRTLDTWAQLRWALVGDLRTCYENFSDQWIPLAGTTLHKSKLWNAIGKTPGHRYLSRKSGWVNDPCNPVQGRPRQDSGDVFYRRQMMKMNGGLKLRFIWWQHLRFKMIESPLSRTYKHAWIAEVFWPELLTAL